MLFNEIKDFKNKHPHWSPEDMSTSPAVKKTSKVDLEKRLLEYLRLREEAREFRKRAMEADEKAREILEKDEEIRSFANKIDRDTTEKKPSKKRRVEDEETRMEVERPAKVPPPTSSPAKSTSSSPRAGILHYHMGDSGEQIACRKVHPPDEDVFEIYKSQKAKK